MRTPAQAQSSIPLIAPLCPTGPSAIPRNEAAPLRRNKMTLLLYYVALVLAADVGAALLCLGIEKVWPAPSLPIFIALYFLILWDAWVFAVRMTAPETQKAEPVGVAAAPPL
jgi:hypothetical protein